MKQTTRKQSSRRFGNCLRTGILNPRIRRRPARLYRHIPTWPSRQLTAAWRRQTMQRAIRLLRLRRSVARATNQWYVPSWIPRPVRQTLSAPSSPDRMSFTHGTTPERRLSSPRAAFDADRADLLRRLNDVLGDQPSRVQRNTQLFEAMETAAKSDRETQREFERKAKKMRDSADKRDKDRTERMKQAEAMNKIVELIGSTTSAPAPAATATANPPTQTRTPAAASARTQAPAGPAANSSTPAEKPTASTTAGRATSSSASAKPAKSAVKPAVPTPAKRTTLSSQTKPTASSSTKPAAVQAKASNSTTPAAPPSPPTSDGSSTDETETSTGEDEVESDSDDLSDEGDEEEEDEETDDDEEEEEDDQGVEQGKGKAKAKAK